MLDKGWLLIYLAKRGRLSDDYDINNHQQDAYWSTATIRDEIGVHWPEPKLPVLWENVALLYHVFKMPVETKHIFKKAPSPVFGPPHLCPRSVITQSQSDHWIRTAACRHYFPVTLWNENMQLPACDLPSFRWHQYWVEEPLPKVGHGMWLDHADSDSVYLDHHLGSLIFESYLDRSASQG